MKKLKLHLEDLRIDSFATTATEKPKGTVFGEQCTCWTQCGQNTCPGCPTCDASCAGTCGATCNGTCAASCYGTCEWTCDYSCGFTCDFACQSGGGSCPTSPDPRMECTICPA